MTLHFAMSPMSLIAIVLFISAGGCLWGMGALVTLVENDLHDVRWVSFTLGLLCYVLAAMTLYFRIVP